MQDHIHLYVVVMLHLGFAAAICVWQGNERFSRLFAASWVIEAIRAAILLPDVNGIGETHGEEWFALADLLSFFATSLLLCSAAALLRHRVSKKAICAFIGIGVPTVLLSRYVGSRIVENWFSIPIDEARFYCVFFNLIVMFVPLTIVRVTFAWWLYQAWKQSRDVGAIIALTFCLTYAIVEVVIPLQFYFQWYPPWLMFFWCVKVFGFSMGILLFIISRGERTILETNTRLRTALDQLEIAQQQAIGQARLNALGQMAAGVAHDVNNSLTPLMAYAYLLEAQTDLQPDAKEYSRLILLSAEDMAQTVRRLNHFYRESHNREFLESLDVADLVQQTVKLTKPKWQYQARSDGRQISVSTIINSYPMVKADASELRSVMANLIFNACEAIEDVGRIQIKVDNDDDYATVSVTDNGSGMSAEQLQRCLEPFYTSKLQGAGLGLSECYGIIRQHGGEITVDSVPGEQTTVSFTLPLDGERQPEAIEVGTETELERQLANAHASVADQPRDASLPRILCIDDDKRVTDATSRLLSQYPATVDVVGDGHAALDLLAREPFDLILCDQGLPGMDGISILKAIKLQWSDMPVVMVSGWALPDIPDGPQPDAFIAKPFTADVLFSTVREHLRPTAGPRK